MIELDKVHARTAMTYGLKKPQIALISRAKNILDLERIIEKYPNLDWEDTKERIKKIKRVVANSNKEDRKPEIFELPKYDRKELESADEYNYGNVLLLKSVAQDYTYMYRELDVLSIATIKQMLLFTDEYGNNFLKKTLHNVGNTGLQKVLFAIKMYGEQLERQFEIKNDDNNPFTYMLEDRKELVEINLKRIMDYYLDQKDINFVWGSLSSSQRDLYSSVLKSDCPRACSIKRKLINNFASYLTMPEITEIESSNMKSLNRFIK